MNGFSSGSANDKESYGSLTPLKRKMSTDARSVAADVAAVERAAPRIGTHNGSFHCDEALGCFLLTQTEKFQGAKVVRTRDQKILDTCQTVIDVGGVYDPENLRFDHHQKGFDQVFGHGFRTKLSSAGLVYKHFGKEIVSKELKSSENCQGIIAGIDVSSTPFDEKVEKVFVAVYRSFMEAIDGVDNGVNQYNTDSPPLYKNNTDLSSRVGKLNPDWLVDSNCQSQDENFQKAMALTGSEFMECLHYTIRSWLPARSIVVDCLKKSKNVYPTGEIMVLSRFCPWKEHLHTLEQELVVDPLVKYVLYQDGTSESYRVQAVSLSPGDFRSRKALPAVWRGLRDDQLSETSGIPGGIFVHSSGFIGGNKTYEGALKMAVKALEMKE